MRNWGIIITSFYGLVVALLIVTGVGVFIAEVPYSEMFRIYTDWFAWLWVGILVAGQAILLIVSVETSWKRLKPRQHIWVSCITFALFFTVLSLTAVGSILAGALGDEGVEILDSLSKPLAYCVGLWAIWGIVFYLYVRQVPLAINRLTGWLFKGSVLELLIAVPCHVIVRHRDDCSAPAATSFGIAAGLAMMLFSFGPSILFLYRQRMQRYSKSTHKAF